MNVDNTLSLFDLSPTQFAWRAPRPREIETRRAHMSDLLIFDILLASGGIRRPDTYYPPVDAYSLRRLLEAIQGSAYDTLKKDCLIYFLLKWHQDGREERFSEERCIPPQFAALADAYWCLDTGNDPARAVSLLSDARLNRDYSSKIIQALSLTSTPEKYILRYVRTVKPLLTEPDDLDLYIVALAHSSLMEAWQFQRTFREGTDIRSRLIQKILHWCLTPTPRAVALKQLLSLPFSTYEQSIVHDCAMDPPTDIPHDSVPIIQDLVCVRLIQNGQFGAAIKLDRQLSAFHIPGVGIKSKASEKSYRIAQDRRETMNEIMAIMPVAERQLLELELEQLAQTPQPVRRSTLRNRSSLATNTLNTPDLSASWEHIPRPRPQSVTRTPISLGEPPVTSASPRLNAPQFGGVSPIRNTALNGTQASPQGNIAWKISSPATRPPPSTPKSPFASPFSPTQVATSPVTRTNVSSISAPVPAATSRAPPATPTQSISATLPARNGDETTPSRSLFDIAGSANRTRNAFYEPTATAGKKRPFVEDTATSPVQPTVSANPTSPSPDVRRDEPEADVDMHYENEDKEDKEGSDAYRLTSDNDDDHRDTTPENVPVATFPHSMFSPPPPEPRVAPIARTETEIMMPPGAFLAQYNDETPRPSTQSAQERSKKRKTSPAPPPTPARTTRSSARESISARRFPGALMDEDDEEDDDLAPLPAPTATKRPVRKTRSSRGGVREEARPTRRSTRLSVASSAGSSSPEPSPVKPTRSQRGGRTSTGAQAPAKTPKRKR